MNFVKIKTVNQSSLKDSQQEQHNNEMYINLDQIISFEYDDLDIKNSKSEDRTIGGTTKDKALDYSDSVADLKNVVTNSMQGKMYAYKNRKRRRMRPSPYNV